MRRKNVKKIFIEGLREANKEKGDPKVKELIQELKKRRFGVFKHTHLKKAIFLVQREGGREGAKFTDPRGRGWPDYFTIGGNTEIMLLWEEDLENEEDVVAMTKAFFDYDRHEMPYIM